MTFHQRRAFCPSCPFKGGVAKSEGWDEIVAEVRANGFVGEEPWPCHEDDPYGIHGVQCRGHAEGTRMLRRVVAAR